MNRGALTEARVWFGVLAAPLAWAVEHVFGYGLSEATCAPGGGASTAGFHAGAVAVSGVGVLLALAGLLAGISVLRATSAEAPPPAGRRHFLGAVAVTVSPLFVVLMTMSAVGALAVDGCRVS